MKTKLAILLLPLFLSSVVVAEKLDMDIQGTCKEFDITLIASGFEEGCYDVKIDVTSPMGRGEIYDEREGWKSTYYFINEALCIDGDGNETFQIRSRTSDNLNVLAKIRLDNDIWESRYREIDQTCVRQEDMFIAFLIAMVVVLIHFLLIACYVKVWK